MFYAFNGFGPNDYVNQKIYPENFIKDFLGVSLSQHYDRSVIMKIFYWAKIYANLDPDVTVFFFIFFQSLFFIWSLSFLLRSFIEYDYVIFLYLIPVLIFSSLAGVDLSRFGTGFGSFLQMPLYYGWSIACSFLALAYSMREHYTKMFLSLAVSCLFHVTIGFLSTVFVCLFYIFFPKYIIKFSWLRGAGLFVLILICHFLFNLGFGENILKTGEIQISEWVKMTKIFCYHWYPLSMKMFTAATYEFYSIVTLIILGVSSVRLSPIKKDAKSLKIVFGLLGCFILVFIGIIFSDVYPVPTIIKISPQRSSSFISFFLLSFYIYQVAFRLINTSKISLKIVSSLILVYIVFPGLDWRSRLIGLILSESFVWVILKTKNLNSELKIIKISYFFVFFSLCFIYLNTLTSTKIVIILFLTLLALLLYLIYTNKSIYLFLGFLIWTFGFYGSFEIIKNRVDYPKAKAFMEIQKWARLNTDPSSLFATDPTHSYAWRDYSARSSFGTFRDWGFVGFAYDSNYILYKEGKRRAQLFGVEFDKITEADLNALPAPIWGKFEPILQNNYYSFSKDQLKELSIKENIDFFVFEKLKASKEILRLQANFQNGYFLLIKSSSL